MRGCATFGLPNEPNDPQPRREFLSGLFGSILYRPPGSFASLISELSSRETGPAADNLMSNEDSYPRVASELARLAPKGSIYLGVGPDQNFTLISHARPAWAFILDYRRRNLRLHLIHKALMILADDRIEYLSRLTARDPASLTKNSSTEDIITTFCAAQFSRQKLDKCIQDVDRILRPLGVLKDDEWSDIATIQAKLAGPGLDARFLALRMYPTLSRQIETISRDGRLSHFLASETSYRAVRDLQRADRIVPLVGDLAEPDGLTGLGRWLRQENQKLGVVYVSDVEFFLLRTGRFDIFAANLARLPRSEGAVIVRTSTREIEHPERVKGDSSTTVVRPLDSFLDSAKAGRIKDVDDLFKPSR
jgi:hypothetical protein